MELTVGADPEFFLVQDGRFINAHGLIPGTKKEPHKVNKGAIQVDGMAAEFNIEPAASCTEFINNIKTVREQILARLPNVQASTACVAMFDEDVMSNAPPISLELGCDPDMCAYNGITLNESPVPTKNNMRTAGGHIHVGGYYTDEAYDDFHIYDMARLVRLMDKHIGIYSLLWDKDDLRRTMYGKAGSFRPKLFGVEYRTLSNAWMNNDDVMKFVYDQVLRSVDEYENGEDVDVEVPHTINTSDRSNLGRYDFEIYSTIKKIVEGM